MRSVQSALQCAGFYGPQWPFGQPWQLKPPIAATRRRGRGVKFTMAIKRKTVLRFFGSSLVIGLLCGAAVFGFANWMPNRSAQQHLAQQSPQQRDDKNESGPFAPEDAAGAWSVPGADRDSRAPDWLAPTSGEISSGFGGRWESMHKGVDIANEIGTPIRSASAGTVTESGPASGYGQWVRIQHSDETASIYGHVEDIFVRPGQAVDKGDVIATMGDRGESTGPHLHFQLEIADDPVDFYQDKRAELTR